MRRTNIGYRTMIDSAGHKYSIELLGEISTFLSERKIQLVLDSLYYIHWLNESEKKEIIDRGYLEERIKKIQKDMEKKTIAQLNK